MENKANLFIVGAMKSGTTSFSEVLMQHPAIYFLPIKEPHYFVKQLPKSLYEPSKFFNIDSYFKSEFPQPLHIAKVEKETHYKKLYSLATNQKYIAEASTAYLHAPETPFLLKQYNPNSKIIILLRNPIERAFSHYKMNLGLGREKKTFEAVIKKEIQLYKNNELPWYSCLGMSFYDEPVERYKHLFKNVHIIHFKNFIKQRDGEMRKLCHFLEIDTISSTLLVYKNETRTLRFQKGFYLLKQLGLKDYFSRAFSTNFKKKLFILISSNKKQPILLSSTTRKTLQEIFNKESGKQCC